MDEIETVVENQNPPVEEVVENVTPSVPPTNEPSDAEVYKNFALSQQAANQQLSAEVERLRRLAEQNNAPQEEEVTDEEFQTPAGFRKAMQQEIRKTVAPLIEDNKVVRWNNQLGTAVDQLVSYTPVLGQYRDALKETLKQRMQGVEPTIQNVQIYTTALIGEMALRNPAAFGQVSSPPPEPKVEVTPKPLPPNIPNNRPPASNQKEEVVLSERMKRMKTNMGYTGSDADFHKMVYNEDGLTLPLTKGGK